MILMRRAHHACSVVLAVAVFQGSPARAAAPDPEPGREVYRQFCESCHGPDMVTSSKLVFGMPAWRALLTDEDVGNLWAYVRSGAVR